MAKIIIKFCQMVTLVEKYLPTFVSWKRKQSTPRTCSSYDDGQKEPEISPSASVSQCDQMARYFCKFWAI